MVYVGLVVQGEDYGGWVVVAQRRVAVALLLTGRKKCSVLGCQNRGHWACSCGQSLGLHHCSRWSASGRCTTWSKAMAVDVYRVGRGLGVVYMGRAACGFP